MAEATQDDGTPGADQCAVYLKALGDPWRLKIIKALQVGPMSVSDLALLLECETANVSHHLRVLFHADLVSTQRDGRFIYYRLNRDLLHAGPAKKAFDFGCCKFELAT
jgi:DNA-binding transcriptional ArsR family regulator